MRPCLVGALLALLTPAPAAEAQSALEGWLQQPTMTGDWGGVRKSLRDAGIDLQASLVAEFATNFHGGESDGSTMPNQLQAGAAFDLGKLAGLNGSRASVVVVNRTGGNLANDDIGSIVSVQEIYGGGQNFRLAHLSVGQSLLDGKVDLLAGRIDAGDDFATSPLYCQFQNNNFCGNPVSVPLDSGFTTSPVPSWGGRIELYPTPSYAFRTGVYEVNPTLNDSGNGFKLSTSGATGVIVPVEVEWKPTFGSDALPGSYRIGGSYDTSDADKLDSTVAGPVREASGRWGLWLLADQMVYREAPGSSRGLSVFAAATLNDPDTAIYQYFGMAGAVYTGTFPGRDSDTVALGFAYGRVNENLRDAQREANDADPGSTGAQTYEAAIELNYGLAATPWLTLRPNLQYVIRPGATGDTPNAWVLGFQTSVTF